MHYQMLPHARPGGMAACSNSSSTKADATTSTAWPTTWPLKSTTCSHRRCRQLLGFLKIEEGDAAITPSGTEFANSEILRQKELFRDAAVANVLLLRQIRRAIESKSDHTVPEDFFLDMLDEQFSEEECLRQMETAVAWGRYAELFDFDAGRGASFFPMRKMKKSPQARVKSEVPASPRRTLVTARTWPVVIDMAWPPVVWPSSSPSSALADTGSASPRLSPRSLTPSARCLSTRSTPSSASALLTCSALSLPSPTATLPPTTRASSPGWSPSSTFFSPSPFSASCRQSSFSWSPSFRPPVGHRDGRHPAHLYRTGMEPGL